MSHQSSLTLLRARSTLLRYSNGYVCYIEPSLWRRCIPCNATVDERFSSMMPMMLMTILIIPFIVVVIKAIAIGIGIDGIASKPYPFREGHGS